MVTNWSWILQYLSETEEDLLIENTLFTADSRLDVVGPNFLSNLNLFDDVVEETDGFLVSTGPDLSPFVT